MTRLFRLSAILTVMLCIAIFADLRTGERQPPSDFAMLLSNPDGSPCQRPCLLGMQPGITLFEEAFGMIRNHPLSRASILQENQSNETLFVFADPSIRLMIHKNGDGTLAESDLMLRDVTLGDLINLLGLPAWVNAGVRTAYLYYPSDGLVLYIVNSNRAQPFILDISDPVDTIVLYPSAHPIFVRLPEFAKPWRGFVNVARYSD